MRTAIDRLLEEVLKAQRALGEETFPLSPKVLSDFLKNERAVLAGSDADGLREKLKLVDEAGAVIESRTANAEISSEDAALQSLLSSKGVATEDAQKNRQGVALLSGGRAPCMREESYTPSYSKAKENVSKKEETLKSLSSASDGFVFKDVREKVQHSAGFSDAISAEEAGEFSGSLSSVRNGVGSSASKPSDLSDVPHPVFSNTRKNTDTHLNPQEVNAGDGGLSEQVFASFFPPLSVVNASSHTEAVNDLKARAPASSVTAPTVSDGFSYTETVAGSAEQVISVPSSVPSNFPQTALHMSEAQTSGAVGTPPVVTLPSGTKAEQWAWLKEKVLSCPNCLKHVPEGKKPVFGSGNLDADLFFCGEAPGAEEEEQGEVFVGRAGQLLTKIIEAMGLRRSDVYIGNIMNWRPETPCRIGNRPPTQEEMQFCLPYLIGQVEIVRPKVIVALGLTAVNGLLGYDPQRRMRDCRGQRFEFHQTPLWATYHPSYLLRNGTSVAKRTVWEDMLNVMKFLKMPISEKQERYFL